MRVLRVLIPVLILVGAMTAGAEEAQPQPTDPAMKTGFTLNTKVGVTLISIGSNTNSDLRNEFWAGLGGEMFFSPQVGAFVDLHYIGRGYSVGANSATAGFLDIPFGFTFNLGRAMFSGNSKNRFRLGGFVGVPLASNFTGTLTLSPSKTQAFFGIIVDNMTTFPISEEFALGYTIWVKYGFGSAVAGASSKFLESGIGLAATFF